MELNQVVYLKAVGDNARHNKEVRIEEGTISKIGRKYFEVIRSDYPYSIKFEIKNRKEVTKYLADWQIYFSKQKIMDEIESLELIDKIRKKLSNWGIPDDVTIDQLRKIYEILKTKSTNQLP